MMTPELTAKILAEYEAAKKEGSQTNSYGFPWSTTTYGSDGRALYVHERSDRPGSVRIRFQASDAEIAAGKPKRPRLNVETPKPIRDDRGRLRQRQLDRAIEEAKAEFERWLKPFGPATQGQPWTLRRMFRHYTETSDRRHRRWFRDNIGSFPLDPNRPGLHLAVVDRILGLDMLVDEWTDDHAAKLISEQAEAARGTGQKGEKAIKVVSTVFAAANHCRQQPGFPKTKCVAPRRWKAKARATWLAITEVDPHPERPRYDKAEAAKIVAGLEKAEPRLRLALVLGTGYRVQQVAGSAKRSDLKDGEGPYGQRLHVMDLKKGKTTKIDLTPRQQRELRYEMTEGFLSELEASYQSENGIEDYYLITGGRLKGGKAQIRYSGNPLTRGRVARLMREYEAAIGVPHVDKRLFHGLRRAMEKLVGEHTQDEAVRDIAGGWAVGSGTRETIYTDAEDEERMALAAAARAAAIESLAAPLSPAALVEDLAFGARRLARAVEEAASEEELTLTEAMELAKQLIEVLEKAARSAVDEGDSEPETSE